MLNPPSFNPGVFIQTEKAKREKVGKGRKEKERKKKENPESTHYPA